MVVLDNYSVHQSQPVRDVQPAWEAANIFLASLPSYCPEMSSIEPVWNDVKHHHMSTRSFEYVANPKAHVDAALARKARLLKQAKDTSKKLHHTAI
jgi:transposase